MILYNDKVIYGWSLNPDTGEVYNDATGEVKKTWIANTGYEGTCINGIAFNIHRAMACTYLGVHGSDWDVHHIDENKLNNRLSNLKWEEHWKHAEETNEGKPKSEEHKAKISAMLKDKFKGENNPMYGRHHSEETRTKMSANHPDISGVNNPMYGQHHSEETRAKQSAARKRYLERKRAEKSLEINSNSIVENK